MITGLGTDIVEISRVLQVYENTGEAFIERILTAGEQADIPKNPDRLPAYLAKRFAVKEAAAKALGTGIAEGVSFLDFEVQHTDLGAPILNVSGKAREIAEIRGVSNWHVSISDEQYYVVATVILET